MTNQFRVAYDEFDLPDGRLVRVSTVRLPITHDGGDFETMVFPGHDRWGELYCARYWDEGVAAEAHRALVADLRAGNIDMLDCYDDEEDD